MKTPRTFRLETNLSKKLDQICERHGDVTWHLEQALKRYDPIKKLIIEERLSQPRAVK